MERILKILSLAVCLIGLAGVANAACYADYKARRDNPLKLHYGVMRVSACDAGAARPDVESRLAANGWTLLTVLGVFDDTGLEQRKANAGSYFLRF